MKRTGYLKVFLDWQERFRKLSDAEFGRLIRAALTYMREGVVPQLTGREELVFDGVRLEIDRDNEAYDATCEARQRAGRAGAEARWKTDGKDGKCHFEHGKNGEEEDKDKDEDQDKDALLRAQARGARAEQKTFKDADAVDEANGVRALWASDEGAGGMPSGYEPPDARGRDSRDRCRAQTSRTGAGVGYGDCAGRERNRSSRGSPRKDMFSNGCPNRTVRMEEMTNVVDFSDDDGDASYDALS